MNILLSYSPQQQIPECRAFENICLLQPDGHSNIYIKNRVMVVDVLGRCNNMLLRKDLP